MFSYIRARIIVESDENRTRREYRRSLRKLRDASNPMELSEGAFRKLFRLDKEGTKYLIDIDRLEPHAKASAIPFTLWFLCALHFFGQGSYQLSVGSCHLLALSQSSVSRAIREIVTLVNNHLVAEFIEFPRTIIKIAETKERFHSKFGMTGVIGVIDGCQIAIAAPPENDEYYSGNTFRNRKGYHSLNVLMCCNADMHITYANARFRGSVHDSAIWLTSKLRHFCVEKFTTVQDQSRFLLGDSGFPLEPWLFVPISNPQPNTGESRFNLKHIKTRIIVEKCFGVLKGRFRCLLRHRTLHYHPVMAGRIIYTVCALHNFCIKRHIECDEDISDTEEDAIHQENSMGRESRPAFLKKFRLQAQRGTEKAVE